MKNNQQKNEKNIFHYIDKINSMCEDAIKKGESNEALHAKISSMCVKCFKPANEVEYCEICNGHTNTTESLYLNFGCLLDSFEKEYEALKKIGMLYELFPIATGNYEKDKFMWEKYYEKEIKPHRK